MKILRNIAMIALVICSQSIRAMEDEDLERKEARALLAEEEEAADTTQQSAADASDEDAMMREAIEASMRQQEERRKAAEQEEKDLQPAIEERKATTQAQQKQGQELTKEQRLVYKQALVRAMTESTYTEPAQERLERERHEAQVMRAIRVGQD